jgi:TusA-related sulfurtransferase
MNIDPAKTLDVKGENCPMPVVKTRGAFDDLGAGETLEVVATDSGSMSDIEGWAEATDGAELLDQVETSEDGLDVYRHYIRKAAYS